MISAIRDQVVPIERDASSSARNSASFSLWSNIPPCQPPRYKSNETTKLILLDVTLSFLVVFLVEVIDCLLSILNGLLLFGCRPLFPMPNLLFLPLTPFPNQNHVNHSEGKNEKKNIGYYLIGSGSPSSSWAGTYAGG